jgi:hypothetical protein
VLPTRLYDARVQASNGITVSNNIYDIAPSIAFTYTTPPLLAEGTEFSTKIYLNNYVCNSATDYLTGKNTNVDFAVSEHVGRWQLALPAITCDNSPTRPRRPSSSKRAVRCSPITPP